METSFHPPKKETKVIVQLEHQEVLGANASGRAQLDTLDKIAPKIQTEVVVSELGIKLDVHIPSEGRYYEVETLFGGVPTHLKR